MFWDAGDATSDRIFASASKKRRLDVALDRVLVEVCKSMFTSTVCRVTSFRKLLLSALKYFSQVGWEYRRPLEIRSISGLNSILCRDKRGS